VPVPEGSLRRLDDLQHLHKGGGLQGRPPQGPPSQPCSTAAGASTSAVDHKRSGYTHICGTHTTTWAIHPTAQAQWSVAPHLPCRPLRVIVSAGVVGQDTLHVETGASPQLAHQALGPCQGHAQATHTRVNLGGNRVRGVTTHRGHVHMEAAGIGGARGRLLSRHTRESDHTHKEGA
jgi:hypothetical protein